VKTLIFDSTEPKNGIVKQYQKMFRMEDQRVEFTPAALKLIAERALKRDTGARALRAVCEEIMLDMMVTSCRTSNAAENISSRRKWSKGMRTCSTEAGTTQGIG